ncbi:hypothetical protein Tco_0479193 [Tanacetum coccineum]
MEKLQIAFQAWKDNIQQKKEQEDKQIAEEQVDKARYWKIPICNDDDEDDTIAITPVLPIEKPDNSLSMGDDRLSTISKIKFNPIHNEDLDSTSKNNCFDTKSYLLESLLNHDTLMLLPQDDSLLDEFARRTHNNSSNELEEIDIFPVRMTQYHRVLRVMITTRKLTIILLPFPSSNHFMFDKPETRESTNDVVEDIPMNVPNILPTHPTLHMDFDFIPSHNDLGSDLDVSSPSGDINKIYDPGICIEVESTKFLATLSPVIDILLPFSSENEDKVFITVFLLQKRNLLLLHHIRALKLPSFFIIKVRC